MKVSLQCALSDAHIDVQQAYNQRQLSIAVAAIADAQRRKAPLNLCLILDQSGSMSGQPLMTVRQAAHRLIDRLSPGDRLSIVAFNHHAKVLVPNQEVNDAASLKAQIDSLHADGGTAIDEGLRVGIDELIKGKQGAISQAFLLTDGENEHGSNDHCLDLARVAANYNMTVSALGFGDYWNQDVLEQIVDAGGGPLTYIEQPEQAVAAFERLFQRIQAVQLTSAHLYLTLGPSVRLADLKPLAQVAPETSELSFQQEKGRYIVRLGDLMSNVQRIVLVNLYIGALKPGAQTIATVQIRYDDPERNKGGVLSDSVIVEGVGQQEYRPAPNPQVQQYILALAKYRQTQIAETRLQEGDRAGAVTMLQVAAKTAMQLGDVKGATVLQGSATRLQTGEELSEGDRKRTRLVAKTIMNTSGTPE